MTKVRSIREMTGGERRAVMSKLGATLLEKADHARSDGNEALAVVMRSVGAAIEEACSEIAVEDVTLAEDVVARAVSLIVTFRCLYPEDRVVTIH